jgi:hypothetical protein
MYIYMYCKLLYRKTSEEYLHFIKVRQIFECVDLIDVILLIK